MTEENKNTTMDENKNTTWVDSREFWIVKRQKTLARGIHELFRENKPQNDLLRQYVIELHSMVVPEFAAEKPSLNLNPQRKNPAEEKAGRILASLNNGIKSVEEIAAETQITPESVYRLLLSLIKSNLVGR